jgi:hypothetical protein
MVARDGGSNPSGRPSPDGTTLANGASLIQVKVITGDKLTLVVDSKAKPSGNVSFNLNITKQ